MDDKKLQSLPEAPASATLKFKSKNGFEYLFTLRENTGTHLLDKLDLLEADLLNRGATPIHQQSYGTKSPLVTKPCPTHPEEVLTEKVSKASGRKYFSHSKGVFPNLTMCFGHGFVDKEQGGGY